MFDSTDPPTKYRFPPKVRGVWWTKTAPANYDPLDDALQPENYAAAQIRELAG